jgi:alanyl-tRNA synthetase
MIGNWSLGDYFKDEQLPWVYEFFIDVLGLDPRRLFATVFEGDSNAPKDVQSINIIKNIFAKYGIKAEENERIFACGSDENCWQRGDAPGELGGPDSEVYYYLGDGSGEGKNPSMFEDDFLEIGNSVFMQYKKTDEGTWSELPQKNVDFGGGLERIAMVAQNKHDIFETDMFWPLIEKIQELSGKMYRDSPEITKAMRILADHIEG